MIDPITRWFEIMQHNDKITITIENLEETTCLTRHPWTTEIIEDQG